MPFSDYAFNRAHTASYGLVSYWTAYLKANHPAEFMAALLTSVADDKDKIAIYLNECRRMGISVLPPDVNESAANFTAVGEDIRFGLTAVRNVGHNVVDGIVSAREANGKAVSFHGFLDQVPLVVCNKRVIESLVKAGAFDSMGHTRRGLMSVYDSAVDAVLDLKRNEAHGQDDLFGDLAETDPVLTGAVPDLPDWDKRTKLAFEREMLGLYVSDHPLQGLDHVLAAERDVGIGQLLAEDGPREGQVTIAGMITSVTRKTSRRGDIWAVIVVEDLEASIEVLLFPKAYDAVATVLATDTVVKVKGRVKVDDETVVAERLRAEPAGRLRGAVRPGDDLAARRPVHPGGARPAAGGAGPSSRDDRGADPAAETRRHSHRPAAPAPGDPVSAADGRSQGSAGTVVPRDLARAVAFGLLGLGLGAAAGVGWWAVVDLPAYVVNPDGGASISERGLTEFLGGDAWFCALGLIVSGADRAGRVALVPRSGLAACARSLRIGRRRLAGLLAGRLSARAGGVRTAAGRRPAR